MVGRGSSLERIGPLVAGLQQGRGASVLISGEGGVGKTRFLHEVEAIARSGGLAVHLIRGLEGGSPLLPFANALNGIRASPSDDVTEPIAIEEVFVLLPPGRLLVHRHRTLRPFGDEGNLQALLQTIQTFLESSFDPGNESGEGRLQELTYGRYRILLETADPIVVALVAIGGRPEALREGLRASSREIARLVSRHLSPAQLGAAPPSDPLPAELLMSVEDVVDRLLEAPIVRPIPDREAPYRSAQGPAAPREDALRALEATAQDHPLLLLIDDLHWLDDESLALVGALLQSSDRLPLLVCGSVRQDGVESAGNPSDPPVATLPSQSSYLARWGEHIRLDPLGAADLERWCEILLPGLPTTDDLIRAVIALSDGLPFFFEELIQALWTEGALRWDGTKVVSSPPREEQLPLSGPLVDSVLRRVEALTERQRKILSTAAVIGNSFPVDVLLATLGESDAGPVDGSPDGLQEDVGEEELLLALDDLQHRGLLQEVDRFEGYRFRQQIVREVLYRDLGKASRRLLHRHVAESIESVYSARRAAHLYDLAYHYQRGRDPHRAFVVTREAAAQANRSHEFSRGAAFNLQALTLITRLAPEELRIAEGPLRAELAMQLWFLGDLSALIEVTTVGIAGHLPPLERVQLLLRRTGARRLRGETEAANADLTLAERLLQENQGHPELPEWEQWTCTERALARVGAGEVGGLEGLREAVRRARTLQEPARLVSSLGLLCEALLEYEMAGAAVDPLREATRQASAHGLLHHQVRLRRLEGDLLLQGGALRDAARAYREASARAEKLDLEYERDLLRLCLARLDLRAGHLEDARSRASEVEASARSKGLLPLQAHALLLEANLRHVRHEHAAAGEAFEMAIGLLHRSGRLRALQSALRRSGELLLLRGATEHARIPLGRALDLARRREDRVGVSQLELLLEEAVADPVPYSGNGEMLNQLVELAQSVSLGEGGGAVLLQGPMGIGKSRLTRELSYRLQGEGWHVYAASGSSPDSGTPYASLLMALAKTQGWRDFPPPAALIEWLEIGESPHPPGGEALPQSSVLPGPPRALISDAEDLQRYRDRLFEALGRYFTAAAHRRPTMLVVDNLQWVDISTMQLLHFLSRMEETGPLLMVMVFATDLPDSGQRTAHVRDTLRLMNREKLLTTLTMVPLGLDDVRGMSESFFGAALSPEVVESLMERSQGNPFFLLSILHELRASGLGPISLEGVELQSVVTAASVQGLVERRLERLPLQEAALLDLCAVIGPQVPLWTLEVLGKGLTQEPLTLLEGLTRAALLEETAGETIHFSHTLIQVVVYGRLTEERRRALHGEVANALTQRLGGIPALSAALAGLSEPAAFEGSVPSALPLAVLSEVFEAARHLREAQEWGDAARFALLAGKVAASQLAPAETCRYLQWAQEALVQVAASEHLQLQVLQRLWACAESTGELDRSLQTAARAAKVAAVLGDAVVQSRALLQQGRLWSVKGQWPEGERQMQEAAALVQSPQHRREHAQVELELARNRRRQGRFGPATEAVISALRGGIELDDGPIITRALLERGAILIDCGDWEGARGYLHQCLQRASEGSFPDLVPWAHYRLGSLEAASQRWSVALDLFEQSANEALRQGLTRLEAYGLLGQAECLARLGRSVVAEERCGRALVRFERFDEVVMIATAHRVMGIIHWRNGKREQALAALREAVRLGEQIGSPLVLADAHLDLAATLLEDHQAPAAAQHLQEAERIYGAIGATGGPRRIGVLRERLESRGSRRRL